MSHDILDDEKIKNEIKRIFLQVFPKSEEDFEWEKHQKDYDGWDSFAQLNLITLSEAKFNVELSLDESIEIKSADQLFECIKSHLT